MTSAVRHQHLPARLEQRVATRPAAEFPSQPPGLLASRYFWLGGLASIGIWTLVFLAIYWFL